MNHTSDAPVALSIPAKAESLEIARMVVVSAAARCLPIDQLDDVALAVHEASLQLIEFAGPHVLHIELWPSRWGVDVAVSADRSVAPWPPPDWQDTLSGRVIGALVDSVAFNKGATGSSVRLTMAVKKPAD